MKKLKLYLSLIMLSLFSVISSFADEVPEATAVAEESTNTLSLKPFIIAGVIIGFILALVLAIRKANKLYGKGWN